MSLKMDEARDHAKQEALVAFEEREDELRLVLLLLNCFLLLEIVS